MLTNKIPFIPGLNRSLYQGANGDPYATPDAMTHEELESVANALLEQRRECVRLRILAQEAAFKVESAKSTQQQIESTLIGHSLHHNGGASFLIPIKDGFLRVCHGSEGGITEERLLPG